MKIEETLEKVLEGVEGQKVAIDKQKEEVIEIKSAVDKFKDTFVSKESVQDLEVQLKSLTDANDLSANKIEEILGIIEHQKKVESEGKSFNDALEESIFGAEAEIKSIFNTSAGSLGFEGARIELKAGDMSYASNFANDSAKVLTTEYRSGLLMPREQDLYLRNLFPQGKTSKPNLWYPKYTGQVDGPEIWDDTASPRLAKKQFAFNFDSAQANVYWIAGIVKIPREMLEDLEWLNSFLRQHMLKALYRSENYQLLHGTGVKELEGLLTIAKEYDGTATIPVERIVDAAYGQIVDNSHSPTNILLSSRDAITIAFNKAQGSGEYNLPPGVVGYVDGRLTIAGLPVTTLPANVLDRGTFLTGDFTTSQFVTRMVPELRFFEQNQDDVEKNMITARIEERVALVNYYDNAYVADTLAPAAP